MSEPLLCVEGLTKTFRGAAEPVIRDVSFCVHPGEAFVLVGPSGCGKTTTLRTIMGFEAADRGVVKHGGRLLQGPAVLVPPERRGIGYVFQDYALFPHLSVRENVMYGVRGVPRRRRRQIANECLWMVGLMGLEDRRPHDLSGGQQQRVALARAIAPGSRVILLDEPFSNLDPDLRQATRSEVRMLAERTGLGIVLVTHDQEEALSTADRLGVMRQGVLEQIGSPRDVYARPASPFVAQFLGRTNLIEARAQGATAQTPLGIIPLAGDGVGRVVLSLRPEHLALRPPGGGHPVGRVVSREFKGHDMTYRVRLGSREYLVQTDFDCRFEPGQDVSMAPRAAAAIVESNALPQPDRPAATPAPTALRP